MIGRRHLALAIPLVASGALTLPAAAVDMPTRKAGLWELTMAMTSGRAMTMSQCTDATTDKDMVTLSSPAAQDCTKQEMQKTATGYTGDAVCKIGAMTMTSHSEVSGDFNSAYTVNVTSKNEGAPAGMPANTNMTMQAKWLGPCKADQKPGDIIMPGGMKMNIKDLQAMKNLMPKH